MFKIKHALELLKDTFESEAVVVTFEIILSASNQQWHFDNSNLHSRIQKVFKYLGNFKYINAMYFLQII